MELEQAAKISVGVELSVMPSVGLVMVNKADDRFPKGKLVAGS